MTMNLDAALIKAILVQVASEPNLPFHTFNFDGVDYEVLNAHKEFLIKEHLLTGYHEKDAGGNKHWFVNGITERGVEHLRKM